MRDPLKLFAKVRTEQDKARPSGNHGLFFFRRKKLEEEGRDYQDPKELFRRMRSKQDKDRPEGATDMIMRRPEENTH